MSQKLCKIKSVSVRYRKGTSINIASTAVASGRSNKRAGKAALGVVVMVGGTAVTVLSKGKINPNKK